MKRLLMVIVIVALMIPAGQAFAASTTESVKVSYAPMHYVVDDIEYTPPADQVGFIYTNEKSTYVPVRFVATILNKSVVWDAKLNKVTISDPHVIDPIDSGVNGWETIRKYLDAQVVVNSVIEPLDQSKVVRKSIDVTLTNVIYEFDGANVKPNANTPGFLYKGRLYVPLRFMYESLGFVVDWNAQTYAITTVTTPKQLEYQTIVKSADTTIMTKVNTLTKELVGLFFTKGTMTVEEEAAAKVYVDKELIDARAEVEAWLADLTETLTDAGFPIDIVEEYNTKIDTLEKTARSYF